MVSPPARSQGCCTRNPRDSETPFDGLARRTSGGDAHRRTHSTDSSGRANSIGRSSSWRNFCTMRNSGSSVRSEHGSASAGSKIHGVARLGRYVNGLKQGTMKATDQSRVIREAKATALVDGGQSLGQVVGKKAMDLAIHKARDTSVGVVAVRNSNHYGIAGYYALIALEHNLIGVSMTNAGPLVVPTFGRTSTLRPNPISLAAPAMKEKSFVLDMATSTVPRGKVEVYNRVGQPMPHGWAVDETVRSSTDPALVLNAIAMLLGGGLLTL